MKKALFLGIASSFFFAFTFLLNRSMNLTGGYWGFSASLRYLFTLPFLYVLVKKRYGFHSLHSLWKINFFDWLVWSTVGFGLFYAPLSYAADHGQSWLVAACWQITIAAGIFLSPLFGKKIALRNVAAAAIILTGVFFMEWTHIKHMELEMLSKLMVPIFIAAISYPLGNRKMMELCKDQISTAERVYGMTLFSIPFWIVIFAFSVSKTGAPSFSQSLQSLLAALFSGVIATLLYFKATDLVKTNHKWLAVIESTQSGEVIFTLLGGIFLLGDQIPDPAGFLGIALIVSGMIFNSILSSR